MGQHRLKQGEGGGGVVAEVDLGPRHGLAGFNERGEVEDAVEGLALLLGGDEKVFKRGTVSQLPLNKFHPCRQKIAPPVAQVVKNDGWCPVSASSPATVPPMYPAPPVTNIFTNKLPFPERFGLP